jgi:hypothetical protein
MGDGYTSPSIFANQSIELVEVDLLRRLAAMLIPQKTNFRLVRCGAYHDGGYLIPVDLDGISVCFSPGVSDVAGFEKSLYEGTGIGSHQADYSVDAPPDMFTPLSFIKKFLGAHNGDIFITMESWVKSQAEYQLGKDFILQMDIEGAEYETLLATPDDVLNRFRIIVLELHNIEMWALPCFFPIAKAFLHKLCAAFHVVHSHPNNWGKSFDVNGFIMPSSLELTFLRKDRSPTFGACDVFPHPQDTPCNPTLPDWVLPVGFR